MDICKEKVIEKIKKLFRLANSDNENEAFLALKNAEKLMREHSIKEIDLSENIDITELTFHEGRLMGWKNYLSQIVAHLFYCKVGSHKPWHSNKTSHIFVGTVSSVRTCEEVYNRLVGWIELKSKFNYPSGQISKRNEYKNGIVGGIFERILPIFEERKSEPETLKNSLMVINDKIDEHTSDWGKTDRQKPMRTGAETHKGFEDGKEAPIFQEVTN